MDVMLYGAEGGGVYFGQKSVKNEGISTGWNGRG